MVLPGLTARRKSLFDYCKKNEIKATENENNSVVNRAVLFCVV